MRAVGGYFELELSRGPFQYHAAAAFKSGRSALYYLLLQIRPENVYIPFYTCNALLEPFQQAGVKYTFYEIDETLSPGKLPQLQDNEYFLYINYFDLKKKTVEDLSAHYSDRLIIDCSQAFFQKSNGKSWLFNSCRKFFGVPDGAYLYAPAQQRVTPPTERNENYEVQHLVNRFNGQPEAGYPFFIENERKCGTEQKAMSQLTEHLLSHVDFEQCLQRRKENFSFLHSVFKKTNLLPLETDNDAGPMGYPLLPVKEITHAQLWKHQAFVPILWKDVANRNADGYSWEKNLSNRLLCLPVDHRYQLSDLEWLANLINKL